MSIQSEINRIKNSKNQLISIIQDAGVNIENTTKIHELSGIIIENDLISKEELGYLVQDQYGNLKFQKLEFEGTTPIPSGEPIDISGCYLYATGVSEPNYNSINMSKNFYKCVTVDTTNNTWTGNVALINSENGAWEFSDIVTSGLTYNKVVPTVGNTYDENCTFKVSDFYLGYDRTFYWKGNSWTIDTQQQYTSTGSINYEPSSYGMPGFNFGGGKITFASSSFAPSKNKARTFSFKFVRTNVGQTSYLVDYGGFQIIFNGLNVKVTIDGTDLFDIFVDANYWSYYTYTFIYDGNGTLTMYQNGNVLQTVTGLNLNTTENTSFNIGPLDGVICEYKVFNYALSAEEISQL